MDEKQLDYADLVAFIIKPLIDHKEDLSVTSSQEEGEVHIEIRAHEDDLGKIIGRRGRVINSIRTLVRAAGSSNHTRVEVEIVE